MYINHFMYDNILFVLFIYRKRTMQKITKKKDDKGKVALML